MSTSSHPLDADHSLKACSSAPFPGLRDGRGGAGWGGGSHPLHPTMLQPQEASTAFPPPVGPSRQHYSFQASALACLVTETPFPVCRAGPFLGACWGPTPRVGALGDWFSLCLHGPDLQILIFWLNGRGCYNAVNEAARRDLAQRIALQPWAKSFLGSMTFKSGVGCKGELSTCKEAS